MEPMVAEVVAMANPMLPHLSARTVHQPNQKEKETVMQHLKLPKHQRHQRLQSPSNMPDQLFTQLRNHP